jgi:phage FluMu protein Com
MIIIKCTNPICGASIKFDRSKNPTATKVRCPKCKEVQNLPKIDFSEQDEEELPDWIRQNDKYVDSSPELKVENFEPTPSSSEEENKESFFIQTEKQNKVISNTPPINLDESNQETGWLVIHDEYTTMKTFNLKAGINKIGRKAHDMPKDINIIIPTEDIYMSRYHCDLEVKWLPGQQRYRYILIDRKSTNGTFVNGSKRLHPKDQITLKDGDTIQIGRTKLVLKLPTTVRNSIEAENWVQSTDHFKTIIQ